MKRALLLAAVLLAGCHKTSANDPTPPPATVAATSAPSVSASDASSAPHLVAPASSAASRADRESAIAEVALGGAASTLPERSTDPAHAFDDHLRDKIVPKKTPPLLKQTKVEVTAGLPREVVMRILRANWGRLRLCYEKGLATKPDLTGTLALTFAIERDGAVTNAKNAGSTVPDPNVVTCAVAVVGSLSFPQPEAAGTRVTYELELKPPS